jgi:YD repeat-containing protein
MAEKRVSMTVGTMTRLTYNGADLTDCVTDAINGVVRDAFRDAMNQRLEQVFVGTLTFTRVRPRIASRQSCLWRHSFDWRNRKRGHPIHR